MARVGLITRIVLISIVNESTNKLKAAGSLSMLKMTNIYEEWMWLKSINQNGDVTFVETI